MAVSRTNLSQEQHRTANKIVFAVVAVILGICMFLVKGCMAAGHYEFSSVTSASQPLADAQAANGRHTQVLVRR